MQPNLLHSMLKCLLWCLTLLCRAGEKVFLSKCARRRTFFKALAGVISTKNMQRDLLRK